MLFRWWRRRRWKKLRAQPFPAHWVPILESLPLLAKLEEGELEELRDHTKVLVYDKSWEGCQGFEITEEVKVTVAALASVLLLRIPHEYYRSVKTILVYAGTFNVHSQGGMVVSEEGDPVLGLAVFRGGPIVLAWDSVVDGARNAQDGRNVVLHEFAHKLDMLDGLADGTPPLANRAQYDAWVSIMTKEYERLGRLADKGRRTLLDTYGATNPAEFFAVATEAFFEKARPLRTKHPDLYTLLATWYGQDPAKR